MRLSGAATTNLEWRDHPPCRSSTRARWCPKRGRRRVLHPYRAAAPDGSALLPSLQSLALTQQRGRETSDACLTPSSSSVLCLSWSPRVRRTSFRRPRRHRREARAWWSTAACIPMCWCCRPRTPACARNREHRRRHRRHHYHHRCRLRNNRCRHRHRPTASRCSGFESHGRRRATDRIHVAALVRGGRAQAAQVSRR